MARKSNVARSFARKFLIWVYWLLIISIFGAVAWLAFEAYQTYRNANP